MAVQLALMGGGFLPASEKVFGCVFNEALVHQAVVTYQARGRAGSKAQKTRGMVIGSGSKPWRQKGTGRARAGSRKSPLWRGGGRTFAAVPKNYAPKLNVKMFRGAIRSVLSELCRQERLFVGRELSMPGHKTKALRNLLASHHMQSVLIVMDAGNASEENFLLASQNLPEVDVIRLSSLNPVALLARRSLVLSEPVVAALENWLA